MQNKFESPDVIITDVMARHAKWRANKPAVIIDDTKLTWHQLNQRINRVANGLKNLGLQKGDKVALLMKNRIEMPEIIFGTIKAGGVIVPLSAMLDGNALARMIKDSYSRFLFVGPELLDIISPYRAELGSISDNSFIFVGTDMEEWNSYVGLIQDSTEQEPEVKLTYEDEFNIMYTSGTTGMPKGILHTHHNRFHFCILLASELRMYSDTIALATVTLNTNGGWIMLLPTLFFGGTLVIMSRFDTKTFFQSDPKIVIAQDNSIRVSGKNLDAGKVNTLLEKGIKSFFDTDNHIKGWKKIIPAGSTVGVKINCLAGKGGASTQIELTESIIRQLVESGIKEEKIIVFDRLSSDLESAGYRINTHGSNYRCYGNYYKGYERNLRISGSVGSLFSRVLTEECDVILNVPVLKDHGICGFTGAMKNMYGVIHNPNKYHEQTGDPYIADLYNYPLIKNKTVITVMDALNCQYNGGPPFFPRWSFPYNGIIIGTDPVALDTVGVSIVEELRKKNNL